MTDRREWEQEDSDPGERDIADLVALVGRRPMPDVADLSRARAAAHAEWQRVVHRRRIPRVAKWVFGGLAAAVVLSAIALQRRPAVFEVRPADPPVSVGNIVAISGPVTILAPNGQRRRAERLSVAVAEGETVETHVTGKVALVLSGGAAVKLDRGSAATLRSRSDLALHRGALYLDTGRHRGGEPDVVIRTSAGSITHQGTQFDIREVGGAVVVRVREGAVIIDRAADRLVAQAGEALRIGPGPASARGRVALHGADWGWVGEVLLPFALEGATLESFLDWATREQGWHWRFESALPRASLSDTVLHGTIDGLTVTEALEAVLPACGIAYRRQENVLILRTLSR